MKYWKEEEISLVETMDFWKGNYIAKLEPNEVFVFGANPQARHFAGAAKAALGFGAVPINTKQNKPGIARGLSPNNKTYALITKSLEAGYTEPETGITYHKEGFQSVSPEQIRANIDELYETAKKPEHLDKKFLVTYQYEAWPNGTPKKSLNGYTSQEMLEMFVKDKDVPPNIVFHESYKPHLEKLYKNQNKQSNGELVVYEDGKSIDIKEEDIVWTIDSDERNPQGIHGAGGAKAALEFGARFSNGRGLMGNSYALVTKNLNAGFTEKATGITYHKDGYCSVSESQIKENIDELYECAKQNLDKKFLITFQYETWPNGSPKKSLNGYTSEEMFQMFVRDDIPNNIIFHDSYKKRLELLVNNKSKSEIVDNLQSNSNLQEENQIITFTKVSLPNGWMSNMAPYPVVYNDVTYKTTEALFQCLRFENYPEIQKEIMNEKSPMAAKMIAKGNRDILVKDGYEFLGNKDLELMRLCINLKLEQHPQLKDELLATGNKKIIEDCSARPQDSGLFWGCAYQNGTWIGKNSLGEILMEKRLELQNQLENKKNMESTKPEYTFFFHLTSPFSNFHPAKFEYKELTFISNEQFMMYSKAKTFKDEETAEKIMNIHKQFSENGSEFKNMEDKIAYQIIHAFKNGKINSEQILKDKESVNAWNNIHKKIKQLGREVKDYDDEIWSRRRFKVVLFGAREKFNQNYHLKDVLINTGNTKMVEASPYDKIWGIGLSEYDAKRIPEDKWPGENLLGQVLDELKIEYNIILQQNNIKKKIKP